MNVKWIRLNDGSLLNLDEVYCIRAIDNDVWYACKSGVKLTCFIVTKRSRLVGKVVHEYFDSEAAAQARVNEIMQMLNC